MAAAPCAPERRTSDSHHALNQLSNPESAVRGEACCNHIATGRKARSERRPTHAPFDGRLPHPKGPCTPASHLSHDVAPPPVRVHEGEGQACVVAASRGVHLLQDLRQLPQMRVKPRVHLWGGAVRVCIGLCGGMNMEWFVRMGAAGGTVLRMLRGAVVTSWHDRARVVVDMGATCS